MTQGLISRGVDPRLFHQQPFSRRRMHAGAAALALLSTAGTAACGAGGAGGTGTGDAKAPGGALAAQKNATLEAWVHADTRSAWQKLTLEDYNKEKGTGVTINWTRLASAGEVADKLVVTTAAGSGFPDLCDVEISQMGKLLKTPNPPLVAYNDYLKGKENDFFKPSFVDPWSLNGKYYGLGNELNVVLLAYRHDVLERAGLKGPFKTWDEFAEAGKRVMSVAPEGMLFVRTGTADTYHVLSIQNGGGYLDKNNKLIVNSPNNVKALQFLADLVHRVKAATLIPSARPGGDAGNVAYKDAVNTGKVATEMGPTWRISGGLRNDAPETSGRWTVQHLPQWSGTGRVTTSHGGTGMTVLKDSKFKEIGIDFLIWEHSTKAVLRDFELRQVWPTYKKAYDDERLTQPIPWFNNQRVGTILKEGADAMLPFYQGIWWPEISSGAGKHIAAAIRNEKPAKQALDEALADAKAAIEAAGGRVDPDGTLR
jgi:arabinosaccharide transport system substrate-binding protein